MTPGHERLLAEMDQYITQLGGFSWSAAYADSLSGAQKSALSNMQTVPATYIRTRSDRIGVVLSPPVVFEYDAKTNESGNDFFVECLPVLHHLQTYRMFNLATVYGFRWVRNETYKDIGIILDESFQAKVDTVFVYPRPEIIKVTNFVTRVYGQWFPNARLISLSTRRGSGDPSIRIIRDTAKNYPHWKDAIDSVVRDASECRQDVSESNAMF